MLHLEVPHPSFVLLISINIFLCCFLSKKVSGLIGWDLDEGGFFGSSAFDGCFLSQPRRRVLLFCIFLSRYFSVSFQYSFFSFTYQKKKRLAAYIYYLSKFNYK